jgi:hypothetical protein
MAIPTLEEFEQVLACINKEIEPDLLEDAKELEVAIKPPRSRNPPTVLPDKEALRRLLTKVAEYRRCRIAAIEKSPAMRWFLGQPGALKARISIYGRKTLTGSSEQEDLIHDENYLLESFRDVTVEDVQAFRAKYSRWEKRLRTDEDVLNEVHSSNVPFTKWRRFTSSLRRVMSRFPYVWEGRVLAALCNYFYTDYWKQYYDEVRSRESD